MNWNPPPKPTVIASFTESAVGSDDRLNVRLDEVVRLRESGWSECQCDNRCEGEER